MPEYQLITPIPGVQVYGKLEGSLAVFLKCSADLPKYVCCPRCQSQRLKTKAYIIRELKHGFWNGKQILLHLKVRKLACQQCGRHFMAPVPGVLPKKRATEQFRQEVFHLHQGGMTQTHLSITHRISTSTVERWYQSFVAYRVKELEGRRCPIVLGIDEHFFTRKQGYATTLVDLRNHKVFDVVLGRDEATLGAYFKQLPGKERVKVVVMDLSEQYRRMIQKYFPNAMIVADRFHVIRWVNHQFLNAWKQFDPEGRRDRKILGLMRRHEWNLDDEQKAKLQFYFLAHPEMKAIYDFKQGLNQLLLNKHINQREAKSLIPQFLWHMNECLESPVAAFKELGKTLRRWKEAIVRMWRFSKSNGITEGLHNKMEMLSRRAFGFRNFQNYRLRVIALCGWNGVFTLRN